MLTVKEFERMIRKDNNLPQYFRSLVLWELSHREVTQFWIQEMEKRLRHFESYLKKEP